MIHQDLEKKTRAWLKTKGLEKCPACGASSITFDDIIQASQTAYVPVICSACAHVRFFSATHMKDVP